MTPCLLRSLVLGASLLAFTACGGPKSTWPAGNYRLDVPAFVQHGTKVLIDSGQIPPEAAGLARDQLKQVTFALDLEAGGSWSCRMGTARESHDYQGTWQLDGQRFSLHQTHEDGNAVTDSMSGTLEGNVLKLHHEENGLEMLYTLRRQGTPAAPD